MLLGSCNWYLYSSQLNSYFNYNVYHSAFMYPLNKYLPSPSHAPGTVAGIEDGGEVGKWLSAPFSWEGVELNMIWQYEFVFCVPCESKQLAYDRSIMTPIRVLLHSYHSSILSSLAILPSFTHPLKLQAKSKPSTLPTQSHIISYQGCWAALLRSLAASEKIVCFFHWTSMFLLAQRLKKKKSNLKSQICHIILFLSKARRQVPYAVEMFLLTFSFHRWVKLLLKGQNPTWAQLLWVWAMLWIKCAGLIKAGAREWKKIREMPICWSSEKRCPFNWDWSVGTRTQEKI